MNWKMLWRQRTRGRKGMEVPSFSVLAGPVLLSLILLTLCHSPVRKVYFTLAVFTNFD